MNHRAGSDRRRIDRPASVLLNPCVALIDPKDDAVKKKLANDVAKETLLLLATIENVEPPATMASHPAETGNGCCVHVTPSGDVAAIVVLAATVQKIVPFQAIADHGTAARENVTERFMPSGEVATIDGPLTGTLHTMQNIVPLQAIATKPT